MRDPSLNLRIRILRGEVAAFGTGKALLLEAIGRCRSIAAGGRELGLSYSKTRRLVDEMNACFTEPLVATARGGAGRGGAQVTAAGSRVLEAFRTMEVRAETAMAEGLAVILAELAKP